MFRPIAFVNKHWGHNGPEYEIAHHIISRIDAIEDRLDSIERLRTLLPIARRAGTTDFTTTQKTADFHKACEELAEWFRINEEGTP